MSKEALEKLFYELEPKDRESFVKELCSRYSSLICNILKRNLKCPKEVTINGRIKKIRN